MGYREIQQEVIRKYRIKIDENSTCWGRTHAHPKERRVCKWKARNSFQSTFTLLHEVGHVMTKTGDMRRCESEYAATVWAFEKCREYGLEIPEKTVRDYQDYIWRELDRGIRRHGRNLPSKESLTLKPWKVV